MTQPKLIYAGIKGSVIALDRETGIQVWAVKLKGIDFVSVALLGRNVVAATSGEVFCMDAQTGKLLWHNPLKGFGLGLVSMAGDGMNITQFEAILQKRKQIEVDSCSSSGDASA